MQPFVFTRSPTPITLPGTCPWIQIPPPFLSLLAIEEIGIVQYEGPFPVNLLQGAPGRVAQGKIAPLGRCIIPGLFLVRTVCPDDAGVGFDERKPFILEFEQMEEFAVLLANERILACCRPAQGCRHFAGRYRKLSRFHRYGGRLLCRNRLLFAGGALASVNCFHGYGGRILRNNRRFHRFALGFGNRFRRWALWVRLRSLQAVRRAPAAKRPLSDVWHPQDEQRPSAYPSCQANPGGGQDSCWSLEESAGPFCCFSSL